MIVTHGYRLDDQISLNYKCNGFSGIFCLIFGVKVTDLITLIDCVAKCDLANRLGVAYCGKQRISMTKEFTITRI